MVAKFFDSATRLQALHDGPGGTMLEGFAQALAQVGYAETTARGHLRAAEHFVYWANRRRPPIRSLTKQALEQFDRYLRRGRCPRFGHRQRLQVLHGTHLFLQYLQDAAIIGTRVAEDADSGPALFIAFCQWMRQQRGTRESTLSTYRNHICELLRQFGEKPGKFDARSLRQFVLAGSRTCGWAAAKKRTTALRMFLRFLIAEGECASGLDGCIPVLAHWRLASLPRYLQPDDVERLIASCDASSAVGRRDRAILLLLARLGLRAGDIVQLRLCDIDWKGAWIQVCGKGRRQALLPLMQEVGEALVAYIEDGRPRTDTDEVFVRCRAPFHAFGSHCAVSVIVGRAFRRAGVKRPSRGAAHLLRHTVATNMLRNGASLHQIAALLRHQSIVTTQVYAKVDVTALRRIAQPWPEVQPC